VIAPLNDPKHKQGQFVFRKETDDDTLAYEAAKAKNTPAAYTDYLQKGYTKHAADVRTRHTALEAADREKRAAADRAAAAIRERNAYNLLDAKFAKGGLSLGDEIRLANAFLETFPQGNYIKNVQTLLENAYAKFAELERLEKEPNEKEEQEKEPNEKEEQEEERIRKQEEERVVKEARTLLYRRIGFTAAAATALYVLFIFIAPYFHKPDPHIDALVTDIENYTNAGGMETEAKNAWQNAYKLAPNDPRLQKWKGKYEN
jgi:hypothetical protein